MEYDRLDSNLMEQYQPQRVSQPSNRMNIGLAFPIIFILLTFFMLFIFLVMMPMALSINTSLWVGGQSIMQDGLLSTAGIADSTVKQSINEVFTGATTSFSTGQSIIGFFTQFWWFIVIVIGIVVMILLARRQVETALV